MRSPAEIVIRECRNQFGGTVFAERNRLVRRRSAVNDSVNTPMLLVAQRVDIGVALAVLETGRSRVMLYDEIVKVRNPYGPVRAYLGVHWREPLIGACDEVESVLFIEACAILLQDCLVHQPSGGL